METLHLAIALANAQEENALKARLRRLCFQNEHPGSANDSACPGSEDSDPIMSLAMIHPFGPSCLASMPWRSEETWVGHGDLAAPLQKKQPSDSSAVDQMWWQSGTLSPGSQARFQKNEDRDVNEIL